MLFARYSRLFASLKLALHIYACLETYLAALKITDKARSAHFSSTNLDKRFKKLLKNLKTEGNLMNMTVPSANSMHIFFEDRYRL